MSKERVQSDFSKKQCPNCYRLCDIHETTCVACGADLSEDVSVLESRPRPPRPPAVRDDSFVAFLAQTLATPWRLFTAIRGGSLAQRLVNACFIFYLASLIVLALAVHFQAEGSSVYFVAGARADFVVVVNVVHFFLLSLIIVLTSSIFGDRAAFVAIFALVGMFLALFNCLELVKVPLSYVPAFGPALLNSFAWFLRVWFALLVFLLLWKGLSWHPVPAFAFAFFIAIIYAFAYALMSGGASFLSGLSAHYDVSSIP